MKVGIHTSTRKQYFGSFVHFECYWGKYSKINLKYVLNKKVAYFLRNCAVMLEQNGPNMNVNMNNAKVMAYDNFSQIFSFRQGRSRIFALILKRMDGCQLQLFICGPSALQK